MKDGRKQPSWKREKQSGSRVLSPPQALETSRVTAILHPVTTAESKWAAQQSLACCSFESEWKQTCYGLILPFYLWGVGEGGLQVAKTGTSWVRPRAQIPPFGPGLGL